MKTLTAEERLQWLEDMHTLHIAVEFLYVVDGFQATVTRDGDPLHGFSHATDKTEYHGETLGEAIDRCAVDWENGRKRGEVS